MSHKRVLVLMAALFIFLAGVAVIRHRNHDQGRVEVTGSPTWQVGPDTITVRYVEAKDRPWTGRIEQPSGLFRPITQLSPSLTEWWEVSHREYGVSAPNTIYILVDMRVSGPNTEQLLSTLEVGLVTSSGLAEHIDGHWTAVPSGNAELSVSIPVPVGTQIEALQVRLKNGERKDFLLKFAQAE
jgi:hypothetical protein